MSELIPHDGVGRRGGSPHVELTVASRSGLRQIDKSDVGFTPRSPLTILEVGWVPRKLKQAGNRQSANATKIPFINYLLCGQVIHLGRHLQGLSDNVLMVKMEQVSCF